MWRAAWWRRQRQVVAGEGRDGARGGRPLGWGWSDGGAAEVTGAVESVGVLRSFGWRCVGWVGSVRVWLDLAGSRWPFARWRLPAVGRWVGRLLSSWFTASDNRNRSICDVTKNRIAKILYYRNLSTKLLNYELVSFSNKIN